MRENEVGRQDTDDLIGKLIQSLIRRLETKQLLSGPASAQHRGTRVGFTRWGLGVVLVPYIIAGGMLSGNHRGRVDPVWTA